MQIGYTFFAYTVPVAAVSMAITWLPTRRLARRSRFWRFLLATIAACGVAPTVANICGSEYIVPAVWVSLASRSGDPVYRWLGVSQGILPLVCFAAVVFCIWSYYAESTRHDT